MASLTIRVLGPFQVKIAEEPVTAFTTDKVRALLVYLALTPDRPHRREALAGILWPEFPERSARSSLRSALANLRQMIRDSEASPPFLFCTRQTIQFNSQSDYWLDADAFEDLLSLQPIVSANLERAISLSRGSFLSGFSLADAAPFEEWLLLRREYYGRLLVEALDKLADLHEGQGDYNLALTHVRRRVELEPWQEQGHRQLMRLLTYNGCRAEAMAVYNTYRRELAAELGVEPAFETTSLFDQIRNDELARPAPTPALEQKRAAVSQLPGFLKQENDAVASPVFVTRENELARLNAHLDNALAGDGHSVFVSGGPGRGKTALLAEFGRRAAAMFPDLLVATGRCNAFSGAGDPYLPFRELMAMLTGDVEPRWLAGAISTDQARRLWQVLPEAVQSLLQHGPDLVGPLLAQQTLFSRAALWSETTTAEHQGAPWRRGLRRLVERQLVDREGTEQSHLFQQLTNTLRCLAAAHPLLLILDDLQWADAASISLLFHLGLRLEGARILIAGAYRAEEIVLNQIPADGRPQSAKGMSQPGQHPLAKLLCEFKRNYGDIQLDLVETSKPEQRRFVDALLDTEPNHLGEDYRRQLASRAGGHPLFTIELVRAMQVRGDLVQDCEGYWIEGPAIDWQALPTKVQGAIEARIGRLEPELYQMLSVACVQGEDLTVQVAAQVLGMTEDELLPRFAQELVRRHRLLLEQSDLAVGPRRLSRFKFSHALVQDYLYQQLTRSERRFLHGKVAAALENCYGEQASEFAVQLAHHYSIAGDDGRALHYFTRAAENAREVYANAEANRHYTNAIDTAGKVSVDTSSLAKLFLARGRVNQRLGDFDTAVADYEQALQLVKSEGEGAHEILAWQAMTNLGKLWSSRDYHRARDCFDDALALAQRMGKPKIYAESLNWLGNWHMNQEDPQAAVACHQKALAILETEGDERDLAITLDLLGIASLIAGDITACVGYYDRAIPLFREMGDQRNLATSLTGRGHTGCSTQNYLTLVTPVIPLTPRQDFEEAARISRQIGSLSGEAWLGWSMGVLEIVQGHYGRALETIQRGLDIATQIEHREWIVGNRCILGILYLELLMLDQAQKYLELALNEAEALGSSVWIRHATGALASMYCLREDGAQARALLAQVLSPETAMDTLGKRYCWLKLAELESRKGNTAQALGIVERLICSAPGIAPGRVISFLWMLKGELLAAAGDIEAGCCLLQAAIENVRLTQERFLLWRLHLSLGRLQSAAGRHAEAEEQFATARESIQELAGSLPAGTLRDDFLQRAQEKLRVSA